MEGKQFECGGFTFLSNFDSANLSRVELVPRKLAVQPESGSKKKSKKSKNNTVNHYISKKPKVIEFPDYEFNLWTSPDCAGTEFENCNRTWFYFGITGGTVFSLVKLNIIDLNKQSKMYSQGMAPVYKIVPGKCQWERIRDKPVFTSENNIFTISFKFRTTENVRAVTYFAFTYPFSYTDLENYLGSIDLKMSKQENHLPKSEIRSNKGLKISNDINDAVYYHRETLCYSLENRKVDLITISSHHNITAERETRLLTLFPDENNPRAFKFQDKKVIFISARVHPGETPSSFVMNGILNLLTQKDDPIAILLRRQFLFKLIPMLNPDGVARGHYRTDTRGCNLNRYYLNPSRELHPSIFGARALIRYHHYGEEIGEDVKLEKLDVSSQVDPIEFSESDFSSPDPESPKPPDYPNDVSNPEASEMVASGKAVLTVDLFPADGSFNGQNSKSSPEDSVGNLSGKRSTESIAEKEEVAEEEAIVKPEGEAEGGGGEEGDSSSVREESAKRCKIQTEYTDKPKWKSKSGKLKKTVRDSGLFLYLDMHGHASKKGVFMYGNHFDKIEDSIECMLLPKLMSVNSQNFHFSACNFTEKNMYLRDKRDGTSREGSGRVAVLRLTGLIRSYTLECNYNTGRFVNKLPQCSRDLPGKANTNLIVPPKYSPSVYEEIGRSLCVSFLDLTNSNPWSRIPNSEYHTLCGVRDWLRIKTISESFLYHRPLSKTLFRSKQPNKSSQTQVMMGVLRSDTRAGKLLSNVLMPQLHSKQTVSGGETENAAAFRGTSRSAILLNRRDQSCHGKRPLGVSSAIQVRAGASTRPPVKSIRKTIYRTAEKCAKFVKPEGGPQPPPSGEADGGRGARREGAERRPKPNSVSDPCLVFKQSPKRLRMSRGDEGGGGGGGGGGGCKIKVPPDWPREEAVPGPSCRSDVLGHSRLGGGGAASGEGKKRILARQRSSSPVKFKKSLEKRRGSDASSRKKSKTLFKRAGKIILKNDSNKNSAERKRRKN